MTLITTGPVSSTLTWQLRTISNFRCIYTKLTVSNKYDTLFHLLCSLEIDEYSLSSKIPQLASEQSIFKCPNTCEVFPEFLESFPFVNKKTHRIHLYNIDHDLSIYKGRDDIIIFLVLLFNERSLPIIALCFTGSLYRWVPPI